MKKIIFILSVILIAVYAVLSILGSKGEYAAEKVFYRVLKAKGEIALNPDVIPPALFESAEIDLHTILEKYSTTNTAKSAQVVLPELYILNKRYDEAINALDNIINNSKQDKIALSEAIFIKGTVYERREQHNEALNQYGILRHEYADTPLGVQVLLYIGDYHARLGNNIEANKIYNNAIGVYKKLGRENRKNPIGYMASTLLLQAYVNLGKFEEAGGVIDRVITDYPTTLTYIRYLPKVDFIFIKSLNRPEKAVEIYKSMREKTDNENLKNILEKKIKDLNS